MLNPVSRANQLEHLYTGLQNTFRVALHYTEVERLQEHYINYSVCQCSYTSFSHDNMFTSTVELIRSLKLAISGVTYQFQQNKQTTTTVLLNLKITTFRLHQLEAIFRQPAIYKLLLYTTAK